MHGCLSVKRIQTAVFTIVEVLWGLCKPVCLSGKLLKPGFTTVVVLWTLCSTVWVSGKMLKAVFTTVLILWRFFMAIWVSGCTDEAFFTTVEVLGSSCTPVCESWWTLKAVFTTGSTVKLIQGSLSIRKEHFSWLLRPCEARARLFECKKGIRRQFLELWRSCEAHARKFAYQGKVQKPGLSLFWLCEACAGQFGCLERCWKQFHHSLYAVKLLTPVWASGWTEEAFFTTVEVLWSSCTPVWGSG